MKALLAGTLVAALALSASAVSPRLNSISPPGAQRGTELEIRLSGSRLDDTAEVVFASRGLQVLKLESVQTNQVKARVKVAKDCSIGEHQVRIRTRGGVSDLRTFWVSAFTNIAENESNHPLDKAQRVPLNVTINGAGGGEDVDFYQIEARQGQRISAEVEAIRLGRVMLDAHLTIYDSDGKELASADDTALLAQDAFVSILAPRDGTYFIAMRDTTYTGSGTAYRLHIGTFPRPAMIYPLGGKAGAKVSFKLLGDPAGEFAQEMKLPDAPDERFGVFASRDGVSAPSPNRIRVSAFDNVLENEPNDRRETATAHYAELPIAFNGIIAKKADADCFRFSAKKDEALEVNVFARRLRSPLDSAIEITDAKGGSIASNDDSAGTDSVVKFNVPADGEYVIRIRDQFQNGGPEFAYRIEATPQEPRIVLSIPQVARNDSQSRQFITVPRGNRFATMISAKRANFSGDLFFGVDGLPGGVKLVADTLPAKQELEPLVFEAAADASITGRFVDLFAKPADTAKAVESEFRHNVEFISGPNNTYYYTTREERLYVAVCEPAPFKLFIEEPKAPLVQYGALDLKIIADRKPGFDEAINVKMMWNPPGVSALPDVTIAKGSNFVVYQLNAKADAELRKWKIAVLGSTGSERSDRPGAVFVSSQLATLEVAEPFVIGTMQPVKVSPGEEAQLICKLDQKKPFEGKARIRVLGLPDNMTASDADITSSDKEVIMKLKVGDKVPFASHRNFLCAADVVHNGQVILHNLAAGAVIRVVPPKKDAPKQVAQSVAPKK